MTPHRRADDLTPKDDDELDEWLGTISARVRRAHRRRDWRDRAIAAFVVVGFLVFSWRIQIAQDRIDKAAEQDRQGAFRQCQLVNDNARALNGLIDTVIARIREADMPDSEKTQAVRLYQSSKQSLPVCRRP